MNAFSHGNLSTAWLRLAEAEAALEALLLHPPAKHSDFEAIARRLHRAQWAVIEAQRLIKDAQAIDDMASADTLPMPPESGVKGRAR